MSGPRRLLVFGATGQLARCLAVQASPQSWDATFLSRQQADLADPAALTRLVADGAWDAVVNAAAYTAVDRAETDADASFAANRDGPATLAAATAARGIPFVHVSTDYVFSGDKTGAYTEDDAVAPLNVYGRSKAEGERLVLDRHPKAVVLRTSWVYSRHGRTFLTTMMRLAGARDRLRVVDDQRGCPTAAADLAAAILGMVPYLTALDAGADRFGLFHFCNAGQSTWFCFAAAIMTLLAARGQDVPILEPITTAQYPTPARRPANSVLDCSRFDAVFGLPRRPWTAALAANLADQGDTMQT